MTAWPIRSDVGRGGFTRSVSRARAFHGNSTPGTTEFYRWWAGPTELKLGLNQQIAVDLDPANWSSVLGRNGTVAPAAFQMALAHLSEIGFSFGGAFYAHGVFADKPAKFSLCDFRLD